MWFSILLLEIFMELHVLFSITHYTTREQVDLRLYLPRVFLIICEPKFLQPVDHILTSGMPQQFNLLPCSIKIPYPTIASQWEFWLLDLVGIKPCFVS